VDLGGISWGDASLPLLSEAEGGEWHEARGRRVVEHRGRPWVESRRCFFQPVHHLPKLSAHEATRPARSCLGFRAARRGCVGAKQQPPGRPGHGSPTVLTACSAVARPQKYYQLTGRG
jgi:hypothetical protein